MKPIITSFVFSEDSQNVPHPNGQGSALHIINPLNLIRPHFIPGSYSFSVAIGLIQLDPKENHIIRFKLFSPSGESIVDTGDINIGNNPSLEPGLPPEVNGIIFNMDFRNVALKNDGKYNGKVYANSELLGDYPVYIYSREMKK